MNLQSWIGLGMLAATSGGLGCSAKTSLGNDSMGGTAGTMTTEGGGSQGSVIAGTGGASPGGGTAGGPPSTLNLAPPEDICPATCEDPAGTVLERFEGIEQFYQHLVGRWQICSGANTFIGPSDIVGVEYEAPTRKTTDYGPLWQGNMFYLVEGADGPERGKGFDYQLKYDVGPQDGGPPNQLNMTSNGTFIASFRYSPCPRQWLLNGMLYPEGARLVPLD